MREDERNQSKILQGRLTVVLLVLASIVVPVVALDGDLPVNTIESVPEYDGVGGYVYAAAVSPAPLPAPRHIFFNVANDAGVRFDLDGAAYGEGNNNTYYIKADGGGLNELHITNDVDSPYGQVTTDDEQSGVFWLTNTGGRGFDDDIIILVSVNGTIPDDFAVHIKSSGYTWTPSSTVNAVPTDYAYTEGAVDEIFTKDDFIYGAQTWKPGPGDLVVPSLPLYYGQALDDPLAESYLMFVDLNVGNMYPSKFAGETLTDNGGAKVEFTFTNLTTAAAFNAYGWCLAANQGQGISWTNRVSDTGSSGYSVAGVPYIPPPAPTADFTANITSGEAPLTVQFTDASTDAPTSWAWDFENDGVVDSTKQNATFTYTTAGTYTVNLTVANAGGSDSEAKTDYITVTEPFETSVLPDYNNIFFNVANNAGVKYNAFGNNTYNVRFEGYDRGLNALHISTDPAVNFGQVTVSADQSGTFYATDSGGKGYEDEIILMVAVNGTIPDNFSLRVTADGYTWTPNPVSNQAPSLDNVTYQPVSLDETFTREDFRYGPQIWKPTGNGFDYPIYAGQNMSDTENTFYLMFIDLNAGVLRPNTDLENRGAVRINYTFENLKTFAAFSVYGYCKNSNNGDNMVAWSNAVLASKAMSGYSVVGQPLPQPGTTIVRDEAASPAYIPTDTDGLPGLGETSILHAAVSNGAGVAGVAIDLSAIGDGDAAPMLSAGNGTWTKGVTSAVASPFSDGAYQPFALRVNATGVNGHSNATVAIPLTVIKNGDANEDNRVTLYDAIYIARHSLGMTGFEAMHENVGDVSDDGSATMADAMYLAKNILGIPGFEMLH